MKCVVCQLDGAHPILVVNGESVGNAHTECSDLAWMAWFDARNGASHYERSLTAWEWRRRRAQVRGQEFKEEMPNPPVARSK